MIKDTKTAALAGTLEILGVLCELCR